MKNLKLYYMKECPFCMKVLNHMKEKDINVDLVDIKADPNNEKELLTLGGKDQVPMLLIDDNPLYESADIIEWFNVNM